eukprot:5185327-Pyramimonas_sp.AAC.1
MPKIGRPVPRAHLSLGFDPDIKESSGYEPYLSPAGIVCAMQTEVGSEPICSSLAPAGTAAAVSPMCVRSRRGLACSTCGGSTFLLGGCDWSGRGLFIPIEGLQLVRRRGIFPLRGCDWSSG